MKIFRQTPIQIPKFGSCANRRLYLLVVDVWGSEMQVTIGFHHIFLHTFSDTEH